VRERATPGAANTDGSPNHTSNGPADMASTTLHHLEELGAEAFALMFGNSAIVVWVIGRAAKYVLAWM
jgi:hypothetical protein